MGFAPITDSDRRPCKKIYANHYQPYTAFTPTKTTVWQRATLSTTPLRRQTYIANGGLSARARRTWLVDSGRLTPTRTTVVSQRVTTGEYKEIRRRRCLVYYAKMNVPLEVVSPAMSVPIRNPPSFKKKPHIISKRLSCSSLPRKRLSFPPPARMLFEFLPASTTFQLKQITDAGVRPRLFFMPATVQTEIGLPKPKPKSQSKRIVRTLTDEMKGQLPPLEDIPSVKRNVVQAIVRTFAM